MNQYFDTLVEDRRAHLSSLVATSAFGEFGSGDEPNVSGWSLEQIGIGIRLIPSEAELPAYIAAAEAFYDKYIAPFDLPYIPNWIEPFVDNGIRRGIEPGIRKAYAALTMGS